MGNFCCSATNLSEEEEPCQNLVIKEKRQSHWGYPYNEKAWKDHCRIPPGKEQSPINLPESMDKLVLAFKFKLQYGIDCINFSEERLPMNLVNNGHTIKMDMGKTHTLTVIDTGDVYELLQFHFHTTSEHTINNNSYALELHLVHMLQGGDNLLVLGMFFDTHGIVSSNDFLASFWDHLPGPGCGTCEYNVDVDLSAIADAISGASFYNYNGSLTTPPLTEGVKWIVMKEVMYCSKEQIVCFQERSGHKGNFRPPQPLGDRVICRAEMVKPEILTVY